MSSKLVKALSSALLLAGIGVSGCVSTESEPAPANPPSPPSPQHRIGIVNALDPPVHAHHGFVVFSNFYDPLTLPVDMPRWAVSQIEQGLQRNGHRLFEIARPRSIHDPAADDQGITGHEHAVMDDSLPELSQIMQAGRLDYLLVVYGWNSGDRFSPNSNFVLKNYGLFSFTTLNSSGAGVYANVEVDVVAARPLRRLTTLSNGNLACKHLSGFTDGAGQRTFEASQLQTISQNLQEAFRHLIDNVVAAFPSGGAVPAAAPDRATRYAAVGCDYDPVSSRDRLPTISEDPWLRGRSG